MDFVAAINECLKRPDFIAVLPPGRVVVIGQNGSLLDGTRVKRDYPRFRAWEISAVTWQVHTREQWAEICERLADEMAEREVALDNR
jgi:trehalose-6-phosphatase